MAEFQEVMKQQRRMCMTIGKCGKCSLCSMDHDCRFMEMIDADYDEAEVEAIERIVMDWAEKNPETRHQSWNEVWRQLFPDSGNRVSPCPQYFLSNNRAAELCAKMECNECRDTPILADIAEKLGIKPIGGEEDA